MKTDEFITSFGYWVRRRRKALDLTQAELAQQVGCALVTLKKIEWDERRPSPQMAERLADYLVIPAAERDHFLGMARGEFVTATLSPSAGVEARLFEPNLPSPVIPFIGRAQELADIARRLKDPACRLLTLVGPGGIGKTRLAIQAAHMLLSMPPAEATFRHGIFFVPLTAISSPSGVVLAIAEAANFTFYSSAPPQQQLLDYLREKEMLLVLDNFEQLLIPPVGEDASGVDLLAEILAVAPAVKLLITSREALNLHEAWFHPVTGMTYPEPPPQSSPSQGEDWVGVESYDAMQLFVQSARRAQVGFSLTAEQKSVVRICQMVEGMPLGIELAATWLKALPCAHIAQGIERDLDFLSSSMRNVPERHRSMRAVFEHSWGLLAEAERGVLRRLSVFRGGFRPEAAEDVAGATLPVLAALVEKSLVQATPAGRYHLHELLRQFAGEKLQAAPPEQVQAQERHSTYYAAFMQRREAALKGAQPQADLAEISVEIENVRAGWNWAVEQDRVEIIAQALTSLHDFYWMRSWFQEGEEVFRRAAESLAGMTETAEGGALGGGAGEIVLGKLLARQGAFGCALGHFEPARELLQKSLALVRRLEAGAETAFALRFLGRVMDAQGELTEAKRLFQESLVISQELGDLPGAVETLHQLSETVMNISGEYHAEAKRYSQESLVLSRAIGDQRLIAYSLDKLAFMTFCLGGYLEAEQYYQESLAIFKEIDDRYGLALALGAPAWIAIGLGGDRLALAKPLAEKSLAIWREIGDRLRTAIRLNQLGQVAIAMEEYAEAQRYYGEALTIGREIGNGVGLWALGGLGEAACGLGDLPAARQYLLETLRTAITREKGHDLTFLYTLLRWATLLAKESAGLDEDSLTREAKKAQVVELLTLVRHHPASWQVFRDRAGRLLAELEAELPPEVAAARERGKTRPLAEVVTEIIGEA
ncbi:MAG: tetratricopeptide repeat protein [Anaerolineales bacterium]|nr:tetratricopeptide repeat protein [Anaerolineales bacterium]